MMWWCEFLLIISTSGRRSNHIIFGDDCLALHDLPRCSKSDGLKTHALNKWIPLPLRKHQAGKSEAGHRSQVYSQTQVSSTTDSPVSLSRRRC